MKVKIIDKTERPIESIFRGYRTCYSALTPTEIKIPQTGSPYTELAMVDDNEKMIEFIKDKIDKTHESPLEHVSFTFAIEGVSRSLTHQLVRHRIASYSQQSQRYVKLDQFEYVIPPEIEKDYSLKEMFIGQMVLSQMTYDGLVEGLMINGRTEKQAIEDARYIFPNSCCSNIIVSMNLRAFRNFFGERGCKNAQWEIRELAEEMMYQVRKFVPFADYKARKCQITCHECYRTISADK